MGLSPEDNKRAKGLLGSVDLSGLDEFPGGVAGEIRAPMPIAEVVFSTNGRNLLSEVGGNGLPSFAILVGEVVDGRAIVSYVAEIIPYAADMTAAFKEARETVQKEDQSRRVIGLYLPENDSERLESFLHPPHDMDFVMSGRMVGEEFLVNARRLDGEGKLLRIPSVRWIELPGS